jgi:hypothetical protein
MIMTYRVSGFCFFLWVLFERFLLPIPMELAPLVSGVVSYCVFWMYIVLYYYYCFVYSVFDLFYSFSLPYTRLVSVRGGINHP